MVKRMPLVFGLTVLVLTSTLALAVETKRTTPQSLAKMDLDAGVASEAPDPLAPADVNAPPPLAPGARPTAPPPVTTPQAGPIVGAVRQKLAEIGRMGNEGEKADHDGLVAFYDTVADGNPVWVGPEGLTLRARQVLSEIRKADDWGLKASAFDLPDAPAGAQPFEVLAKIEFKMSSAILKYARQARGGRFDPPSLSRMLDQKPQIFDPRSVLDGISASDAADAYLRGLHPSHPQFEKLRQALLSARGEKTGETESNADVKLPTGPKLKPGQQHEQIALLRQRLSLPGEAGQEKVYDAALVKAVEAYQAAQGQEPNGIITNVTRSALNGLARRPPADNIQRLLVNMERWRWMPDNLGDIYVWDSVPDQTTQVIENGKSVLSEKIVVGKTSSPTPIFSANMLFIIFHPEWGVPDGIKANELAPQLRRASAENKSNWLFGGGETSADVLRAHDLRVSLNGHPVDANAINWEQVDIRQFQFTQPSGAKNVLGIVKFRFPNKHDVYMHDTPERSLFNGSLRAFSHGCMRVQNPIRLAEVLLARDKGWDAGQVRQSLNRGEEVKLTHPIPVHVTYFTAWVDDGGKVQYKPDIYGVDDRIASALEGRPVQFIAKPDDATKPARVAQTAALRRRNEHKTTQPSLSNPFAGLFGN